MDGRNKQFRNAKKRFNFKHSSCRNVIERAFGILKIRWKVVNRMSSYSFPAQTADVVATMKIYNFLRRLGQIDQGFNLVKTNCNHEEIDMPDEQDQIEEEMNGPQNQNITWDEMHDYMAQMMH
ncbi:DDE Tnp4 domain-containing protein [Abeliophyllum distichum]|uniref:DDE Tnp4 domain-containing protein n=1 Tax=Abeliophyllum distichum TaxID=126358 RepID=A0ABD1V7W2_9LAMI